MYTLISLPPSLPPSLSLSHSLPLPSPFSCRELQSYYTYRPAVSVAVSQRGLLALGRGQVVEVWRDVMGEGGGVEEKQKGPYLTHRLKGEANGVEFCPFEDCLGIGHSNGFTSIIVPGVDLDLKPCDVLPPIVALSLFLSPSVSLKYT